ncbi:hypothetical protein ACT6QE_00690, partial [Staphylococcus aureus]
MKKVMGILLASTLILGACGHHQDSAKKESTSHKKKENDNEAAHEMRKRFTINAKTLVTGHKTRLISFYITEPSRGH